MTGSFLAPAASAGGLEGQPRDGTNNLVICMCIPFANLLNYAEHAFMVKGLFRTCRSSCRDRPVVGAPGPLRRPVPTAPAIPRLHAVSIVHYTCCAGALFRVAPCAV